ncbi:Ferritin-like domain-containing protein [Haladaptatus litoreus]|uniref:Ferritin-like domain-containing protein n=1 Tax=Haladaptatus litoreus TaxID=553468 RepID=A0A1N7FD26_9EURY|nr:ferritin-like domain-containing protein [Haladaptatus litoreus]SIR98261.1 Ferritin-like domain-containing protein [Haladaptatus litoreus]
MTQDPTTKPDTKGIEQANTSMREQLSSRRTFLAGAAAVGAAGMTGLGMGTAGADEHGSGGDDSNSGSGDNSMNDVDILNYALTLEHLEATFYQEGLDEFSADDFMNADLGCGVCDEVKEQIPEQVKVVGEHEAAHVDQLTKVITDLGGTPVEAAEYDFGYETPAEFLGVAMALENTGVAAYAGAAPSIQNSDLLSAALSIHSVEARHAAVFNGVNMESPYPDAFDEAKSMDEVLEIAGQFIVSE